MMATDVLLALLLQGPPQWMRLTDAEVADALRDGHAHIKYAIGEYVTLALTVEGHALLASRE